MSNTIQKTKQVSVVLSDVIDTKRIKRARAYLMMAKKIFDELEITSYKDDSDFFSLLNKCSWELKNGS